MKKNLFMLIMLAVLACCTNPYSIREVEGTGFKGKIVTNSYYINDEYVRDYDDMRLYEQFITLYDSTGKKIESSCLNPGKFRDRHFFCRYYYDESGLLVSEECTFAVPYRYPGGSYSKIFRSTYCDTTKYAYNAEGQMTEASTFDNKGNLKKQEIKRYSDDGKLIFEKEWYRIICYKHSLPFEKDTSSFWENMRSTLFGYMDTYMDSTSYEYYPDHEVTIHNNDTTITYFDQEKRPLKVIGRRDTTFYEYRKDILLKVTKDKWNDEIDTVRFFLNEEGNAVRVEKKNSVETIEYDGDGFDYFLCERNLVTGDTMFTKKISHVDSEGKRIKECCEDFEYGAYRVSKTEVTYYY